MSVNGCVENAQCCCCCEEHERNGGAGHDVVDQVKSLQIGEQQRYHREKDLRHQGGTLLLRPVFARDRLQMSDEVNENHHHECENIGRGECGNKEGQGSEQARLQVNRRDGGQEV